MRPPLISDRLAVLLIGGGLLTLALEQWALSIMYVIASTLAIIACRRTGIRS